MSKKLMVTMDGSKFLVHDVVGYPCLCSWISLWKCVPIAFDEFLIVPINHQSELVLVDVFESHSHSAFLDWEGRALYELWVLSYHLYKHTPSLRIDHRIVKRREMWDPNDFVKHLIGRGFE